MKINRHIISVFAIIFSLIFLVSCAQTEDEREYKTIAKKLNEMLVKLDEIPAPQKHFVTKGGGIYFCYFPENFHSMKEYGLR